MRSGGEHSSASDSKNCNPSTGASALPMHVGYFFRSNIHSVVDYEEIFWAHQSCMEWSVCTGKGESENLLILVAKALTQVFINLCNLFSYKIVARTKLFTMNLINFLRGDDTLKRGCLNLFTT